MLVATIILGVVCGLLVVFVLSRERAHRIAREDWDKAFWKMQRLLSDRGDELEELNEEIVALRERLAESRFSMSRSRLNNDSFAIDLTPER